MCKEARSRHFVHSSQNLLRPEQSLIIMNTTRGLIFKSSLTLSRGSPFFVRRMSSWKETGGETKELAGTV